jgi:acetyl esterase
MTRAGILGRVDAEIRAAVEAADAGWPTPPHLLSPAEVRRLYRAPAPAGAAADFSIENFSVAGAAGRLPARSYRKLALRLPAPCLVYFHGGGFTTGNLDSHDAVCIALATQAECMVLAVDYRLLPDHPFPAAFDDAVASARDVHAQARSFGVDPDRMGLAGDSSGANLALAACLALSKELPKLRALWLAYPIVGMDFDTASYRANSDAPALTRARCMRIWNDYLAGDPSRADWRAAPLLSQSLAAVPAAAVMTAQFDPLRSDGELLVGRLREEGRTALLVEGPGLVHGYLKYLPQSRAARDAFLAGALFVRKHLQQPGVHP